jgi:hypothetical protein
MDTASGIYGQQHLLRASLYRKQLAARFVAWCEITEVTEIRATLSEGCSFLSSFRLSLDKLTKPFDMDAPA